MIKSCFSILFLFICLILTSCRTGEGLISDGSIKMGMSVDEFRKTMLYKSVPSADPFMSRGGGYGEDYKGHKITFGSDRKYFYVFSPQNKLIATAPTMGKAQWFIDRKTRPKKVAGLTTNHNEFQYAEKPPSANTTTLASSLPPCPTDTSLYWTSCFGAFNLDGGDNYVGEWKNNKRNGQGTYIYGPNSEWAGDKYVGEFKDDKINGQGTYLFSDGSKQIGEFTNDLLNGFGTYYSADGTIVKQGIWKDSKFQYAKKPPSTNTTDIASSANLTSAEIAALIASRQEADILRAELAAIKARQAETKNKIASDTQVPLITIASSSADDRRGQITGTARDNIAIAEVRVDGQRVPLKNNGRFEWQGFIPAGGKSVVVEAIDTAGLSSMQQVRIERGQIQQARGPIFADLDPTAGKRVQANNNALALIVGIADYKRTDASAIYADKDGQYFHDYASLKLGIPDSNIKTMLNDKAEQGDVILAVKDWIRRSSTQGKTDVYVFFAGHGLASQDGEKMYLLPFDGHPRLLDDTAISRERLFSDIASANPRSVTVFLDTCYSGTTRSSDMLIASRPIGIRALEQSIPDNFTVMTAAAGDQTAKPLEEAKHGMFSYFLMKGMEGEADANNDNQITASELHAYVEQNVIQQSSGLQTPELQGEASRVLVRFQ